MLQVYPHTHTYIHIAIHIPTVWFRYACGRLCVSFFATVSRSYCVSMRMYWSVSNGWVFSPILSTPPSLDIHLHIGNVSHSTIYSLYIHIFIYIYTWILCDRMGESEKEYDGIKKKKVHEFAFHIERSSVNASNFHFASQSLETFQIYTTLGK